MAGFITRTRLVRTATGTPANRVLLDPPTVFRTGPQGTAVESKAEAMALVPAGQRPPETDWWQYIVQWQVTASVLPTVRGVLPYTLAERAVPLVIDADFWYSDADRLGSLAPVIRNTFTFVFNQRPREYADDLRRAVDDFLVRATWGGWSGDMRDPNTTERASLSPADDPRGLLGNAGIVALNGQPRVLAAVWRGA